VIGDRLALASKIIGPSYAALAGVLTQRRVNKPLLMQIGDSLLDAAEIIHDVARSLPDKEERHDQT
jgi:hypothetical protein